MKIKRIFAKKIYYVGDIEISRFESMVAKTSTTISVMLSDAISNNELSKDEYNDTITILTDLLAMLESTESDGFDCINCKFDVNVADVHDTLAEEGLGMYSLSSIVDKYLDMSFITAYIMTKGMNEIGVILLNMRFILNEFVDILQCVLNNRYYDSVFSKGLGSPIYDFSKVTSKYKYPISEDVTTLNNNDIPSFFPYN